MAIEIFDCEQNSPEWYACRIGVPTASNFQCLLAAKGEGKVRAGYLRQVAAEIITGDPTETFKNGAMDRGHAMEVDARNYYAMLSEDDVKQVGFIRNGRKGCSPDALVGANGLVEFKSQRADLLIETLFKNEVPNEHVAQCQGALWVAERDWVDLSIYWPKMPPFIKRIYRDEGYIMRLAAAVNAFNEELDALVERIRSYGRG